MQGGYIKRGGATKGGKSWVKGGHAEVRAGHLSEKDD